MSQAEPSMAEAYEMNDGSCSEGVVKLPLALFAVERNSKKRLLFDVSSRKIRGVCSSIFPDATCAFENGGWLLMIQHKPRQQIVFLVHAKSGRRLDLPVSPSREEGFFVFYVGSRGTPLVVACVEFCSVVPTVHIACPGDVYWSVYKHGVEPPHMFSEARRGLFVRTYIVDVALVKTHAICLEYSGQVLVFDITEMTWRGMVSCPEWSKKDQHFLVASNGKAVLVSRLQNAFKFFKLDMEALEWSPMDDGELDHTSWFLRKGQSLRARDVGKRKVYTFNAPIKCSGSIGSRKQTSNGMRPRALGTSGQEESKSITNIYAYDLDDGTVEMLIPASLVTEVCQWVQPSIFAT